MNSLLILLPASPGYPQHEQKHMLTRILGLKVLPHALQHWLRDSGAFTRVADFGTYLLGALFVLFKPSLAVRLLRDRPAATVEYGSRGKHLADVFNAHRSAAATASSAGSVGDSGATATQQPQAKPLSPVLLFMHGGAWATGHKLFYRWLAQALDTRLGLVVVVPDYTKWPQGDADAQVEDMRAAGALWRFH